MIPIINILEQIIRKSSLFLLRDFSELEVIQNTDCRTKEFVIHSCNKMRKRIIQEVEKYSENDIGELVFTQDIAGKLPDGKYLVVNLIDNLHNLERTLPFFCIEFTLQTIVQQQRHTKCGIQYFPVIGETYFFDNNGTWVDKFNQQRSNRFRLKVNYSKVSNFKILAMELLSNELLNTIANIKINSIPIFAKQLRCFGSLKYACALFLNGKLDGVVYDSSLANTSDLDLTTLLIKKAGGTIQHINSHTSIVCTPSMKIKIES